MMAIKPKYRILTNQELKELEKEFVQFLISNGIEGEAWSLLNEKDPDRALDLMIVFSDLIFSKIEEETPYFIFSNSKMAQLIKLENNFSQAIWIKSKCLHTDILKILESPQLLFDQSENCIEIFKGSKPVDSLSKVMLDYLDNGYKIDVNGVKFNFVNSIIDGKN